jgi:D-glycero-D-manno-heptose 1,7-bisphosphate phosphatase
MNPMDPKAKILSLEQVDAWVDAEKAAGRRIGFTCGAFDLLHAGHVHYLAEARKMCDCLMVAVNSDESVRRYKSELRPLVPEDQRMYVVAGQEAVDVVTRLDEDRPLSLLLRWKPDLYIKGGGYSTPSLRSAGAVEAYGGEVRVIATEFGLSTTALLDRIGALMIHAEPDKPREPSSRGLALIDRDGTLIRNVPFLHDPGQVELLPGILEGLLNLQNAGFRLAIVSNQQGIGLGYFTTQDFIAVNQRLLRELGAQGILISKIYFCPHSAGDRCDCRKPAPGMIRRAMRDFQAAPDQTWVIGDSPADREAAQAAGCHSILVDSQTSFAAAADGLANPAPGARGAR